MQVANGKDQRKRVKNSLSIKKGIDNIDVK